MTVIKVETIEQLKELYDASAMTWEGITEDSFEDALEACCLQKKDGIGYVTKGKVMNEICGLTGRNAYPDDLTIFSIKNYVGPAIKWCARWMDDIIDNNAYREGHHPFTRIF